MIRESPLLVTYAVLGGARLTGEVERNLAEVARHCAVRHHESRSATHLRQCCGTHSYAPLLYWRNRLGQRAVWVAQLQHHMWLPERPTVGERGE